MADNLTTQSTTPATVPASSVISTEEVVTLNGSAVTAQHVQRVAAAIRTADGTAVDLPGDSANGLDVDVTRVSGTVAVSGPLTDTELRAAAVPVSDGGSSITVDGPLTDTQLRAVAVPVSGTVTANISGSISNSGFTVTNGSGASAVNVQDGGNSITVDGPLTDAQLRATAVPVSGTVTAGQGTATSTANAWPAKMTDGTNVAAVKAALTAAVASDPALVVAVSPNNAVAVTVDGAITVGNTVTIQDGGNQITVDGNVTVGNASGVNAVNIQDGGNSITVDGSVSAAISGSISNTSFGVNNGVGASAVNIQDGGNSITIDGPVAQGSPTSAALAWPTKTTDGTNVAAVKAASTAAVAADPALVVVVSPNTASLPLPTGAATEATLTHVHDDLQTELGLIKTYTSRIPTTPASEHTTAVSPHAARLTDGSAFYKATTPSDTQPVSIAATVTVDTELPAAAALGDAVSNPTAPAVGDCLMLWNGATWQRARVPTVFKAVSLTAATAETTVWTPTTGKKFRVMGMFLNAGAATTLTFKDNTAGTTIIEGYASATAAENLNFGGMGGILSAAANNVLTVTRGSSAALYGMIWGTEE